MNRFIKSVICLVSSLAIAATSGLVTALADDPTLIFGENFDDYKTGSTPTAVATYTNSGTRMTVEEFPSADDKSVCLYGTQNNTYFQKETTTPITGKFYIQGDFYVNNLNGARLMLELRNSASKSFVATNLMNGSYLLFNNQSVAKLTYGAFKTVVWGFDLDKQVMSMWINGRRIVKNVSIDGRGFTNCSFVRFQLTNIVSETSMYINNLYIVQGEYLPQNTKMFFPSSQKGSSSVTEDDEDDEATTKTTDETALSAEDKVASGVCYYERRHNALIKGKKTTIPSATFPSNGKEYVPIKTTIDAFGGSVATSGDDITVNYKADVYKFKVNSTDYYKNGEALQLEQSVLVSENSAFLPSDFMCTLLGKYQFLDLANGICFIIDYDNAFSWTKDYDDLAEILTSFIFTDYSADDIKEMVAGNNPNNQHPRILMHQSDFDDIKARLETDEFTQIAYDNVKKIADSYIDTPCLAYELTDGLRMLSISREAKKRIGSLAMMYKITGDEKYAERCWQEMNMMVHFPTWNPNHFLDVGEAAGAVAVGYDWCYDYLTPAERTVVRNGLVKFALNTAQDDYEDLNRTRTYKWSTVANANNWTFVCNSGITMACLSIMGDDAETDDYAAYIASCAMENIKRVMMDFAPTGSWREGVGYWEFATQYMCFFDRTLDTALGSDLGRFDVPGVRTTVEFVESMNGPGGFYNYSDAGASTGSICPANDFYFAQKTGKPYLGDNRIKLIKKAHSSASYEDLVYYKPNTDSNAETMPLDNEFPIAEVMSMRSNYTDDALYVASHNGWNSESHAHYDKGGFILDSQGVRFITDLGSDDYNLSNYNQCYRKRAEGHNTLVINPTDGADQIPSATVTFNKFESSKRGAFAVADLSPAYTTPGNLTRGIMMADGRNAVYVQDEIALDEPSEVYWFAHTSGDIELSADKKSAIITKSGKKLQVKLLSDDGEFSVMDAKPLPTSPVVAGQNENVGITKLTVHLTNVTNTVISVGFAPYYDYYSFTAPGPISSWSVKDGDLAYETVDSILVNGKPLPDFDPEVYTYTYEYGPETEDSVSVTAPNGTTDDHRDEGSIIGPVVIEPNDTGKSKKNYLVNIAVKTVLGIPDGMTVLPIASYNGSQEPQPENPIKAAFDDDLNTRWASLNQADLDIDLGSEQQIYGVALAFWQGNARKENFRVQYSKDGVNWKETFNGWSSGMTDNYEVIPSGNQYARYIRLEFYGTSVGQWTSLLDLKVLKKD